MAVPTYEMSMDETHPHPSGAFSGVLVFYIDAHALAQKFTQGIRSGKTGYAWIMDSNGIRRLPVEDSNRRPVGVVSLDDLFAAFVDDVVTL